MIDPDEHDDGVVWPEPADEPDTEPAEPWAHPDAPEADDEPQP